MYRIVIIAVTAIFLTSCSKNTEVRDRAFVVALGINYTESDEISVTADIDNSPDSFANTGVTIFDALEKAEKTQGRNLFVGHTELIAFDGKGIKSQLTALLKSNLVPPNCIAVYGDREKIADKSDELRATIQNAAAKGYLIETTLSDTLDSMLGEGETAAVPYINNDEITMCIINNDGVVAVLSCEESRGLALLTQKQENIILPVEIPQDNFNSTTVSFEIEKSTPKIEVSRKDGLPLITFNIKVQGRTLETMYGVTHIQTYLQSSLQSYCRQAIEKTALAHSADLLNIEKALSSSALFQSYSLKKILQLANFSVEVEVV